MGIDSVMQFSAEEDGCIYFYDKKRETWKKICDINTPADLPLSVKKQVRDAQNQAELVLSLPL
jgi:hypothetical protein